MLAHEKKELYKIEGLTKAYGESSAYSEVIKDVNLTIFPGEYLVLLGPSGSGKSTLLYLLAGLETPTEGSIYLRGQDITRLTNNELATFHRIAVGIVYQSFHLLPSFTVLENVAFPLALQGLRLRKREERAMEVLAKFSLDPLADHYPSQISGGQQQKVAIARSLINMPPILLIDEPTGNLDSASSQEVMDIIARIHRQGSRTIILVTHSPEFVKYATRTVHVIDGKIYHQVSEIPQTTLDLATAEKTMLDIKKNRPEEYGSSKIEKTVNPFGNL